MQQEADGHRMLAIKRDTLLQTIRGLRGFKQFLLRKEFSQLRASAHSGPVVILNAAESRCDALIVLADVDHVIHVPLPTFTFQRSAGLQKMLEKLLGHARGIPCDDREGVLQHGTALVGSPFYPTCGTASSNQSWMPWLSQYAMSSHVNSYLICSSVS